ncbi:HAD family phosphatase [Arsenicicoccus piscis]|uniref:Hydrolase n=1 Tax=Arsenicicoccus piscis TaxID=673954 RepID=A0ABQ6HMS0_9MICO|nr:HAD family phosphatase [Arsenicicoccus piscis]MCH8626823.1 HAD family phosphatase [Arsenicicoccus piscis]GMA19277.1 hydrolase [Arsenicicoccus piscis]
MHPQAVVFDLGQVLIAWDPHPAIAAAVGPERATVYLSDEGVDFVGWNHLQDAGRPFDEAEAEAIGRLPHYADEIRAYRTHYAESLRGEIPGTVALLRELHAAGVPLFALTNWPAETFGVARERFDWLELFHDIVVSGEEGAAKPDPALFNALEKRMGLPLTQAFFTDDSPRNVLAASACGLDAVLFTDAEALRRELVSRGLPVRPRP